MIPEEQFEQWLRDSTTKENEENPFKPFAEDEKGNFGPNPDYIQRSEALHEENFGTSFFVNFAPDFYGHQQSDAEGEVNRLKILDQYSARCHEAIGNILREAGIRFGDKKPEVAMSANGNISNNGEMYFWIPGLHLDENTSFEILRLIMHTLRKNPIRIPDENGIKVPFYGWGVRSRSFES